MSWRRAGSATLLAAGGQYCARGPGRWRKQGVAAGRDCPAVACGDSAGPIAPDGFPRLFPECGADKPRGRAALSGATAAVWRVRTLPVRRTAFPPVQRRCPQTGQRCSRFFRAASRGSFFRAGRHAEDVRRAGRLWCSCTRCFNGAFLSLSCFLSLSFFFSLFRRSTRQQHSVTENFPERRGG